MSEELEILNKEQEQFCRNYTQNYDFFGNATLSYANAYGYDIDSEPDDDAVYEFKDGTRMSENEYELLDSSFEKEHGKAYKVEESSRKKMYDSCSQMGSKLRKQFKIQSRCRELLNEFMKDEVVDARLMEIILEGSHSDSVRAIQEFNKLRQRIVTKVDHTSKGNEIKGNTIIFKDYSNGGEETDTGSQ